MWWLVLLSLLVGVGRLTVPGHGLSWPGSYESFAHIWVGFLLGVAVFNRRWREMAIICLVVLSLFELGMFLAR